MLLFIVVGLLGLIVGSFLNVLIVRTPVMAAGGDANQAGEKNKAVGDFDHTEFNLAWPRSHCTHCHHTLSWRELIPLLSYFWQGGKCATCQRAIGVMYHVVECVTAIYAVLLVWFLGPHFITLALFIFGAGLLCMTLTDCRTRLVPDVLSLSFLWLGLWVNTNELFCALPDAIYGAIAGYGILWSVFWVYWGLRKKEGLGYGDFKLMAALGAWLGLAMVPWILLIAAVSGCLYALLRLIGPVKKSVPTGAGAPLPVLQQSIPFAPFLCLGASLAMAWHWYAVMAWHSYLGVQ